LNAGNGANPREGGGGLDKRGTWLGSFLGRGRICVRLRLKDLYEGKTAEKDEEGGSAVER